MTEEHAFVGDKLTFAAHQREQLQPRGGERWAVYQCAVLEKNLIGRTLCLRVGPSCTHQTPPPHAPDSRLGAGWRFRFVGYLSDDQAYVENSKGERLPVVFEEVDDDAD